jgi:hypothetical protein
MGGYFDLRWRILRQPWEQPRGSECDSMDDSAFHSFFLILRVSNWPADVCIFNAPAEAQVRFMAVDDNGRGRGCGSGILEGLGGRGGASPRSEARIKWLVVRPKRFSA